MTLSVNSIILLAVMGMVVGGICYAQWRVRHFSRMLFGTDDLAEGLRKAKQESEATPRSLAALTRLLLPQIQKDFPELNWEEYKEKVRKSVRKYILDAHDTEEIRLHETEIADYRNQSGTCYIRCQTSAGYHGSEGGWIERKYETDLTYVQDVSQIPSTQSALGLNCPNCGAPIKMLGVKTCPYCGTGVTELNIRVWKVGESREIC